MDKRKNVEYGLLTLGTVLLLLYLMFRFLGIELTGVNIYNTYALQAESWRQGRLDLGMDYPWLELAIYNNKYFCSFPPFPSYVLFPFTFLFGSNTPDFILMLFFDLLATFYLYRLVIKLGGRAESAMLLTLFVTVGANTLFVMLYPYVWFIAQLLCFLLAVMAIYYAYSGKGGWALFFWAASVGCRPMQIFFLPVLLLLLFQYEKNKNASVKPMKLVVQHWRWGIPMGVVALSYMILNFLRFGSIVEFGHNYLPEFVREEKGQFHIDYIQNNLESLFRMPQYNDNGRMVINHFGDLNFMLVSPIVIITLIGVIYVHFKKDKKLIIMGWLIVLCSATYLLFITAHRTLGGWGFGNRYSVDILPYIYLLMGMISAKYQGITKYCVPLCVFGICLNVVGTVIVCNGL